MPDRSALSWLRDLTLVFVGGMVGATTRVGLIGLFPADTGRFPWTTFLENVSGAFLLAAVLTFLGRRRGSHRRLQLLVGTGALGAFTTYSTLAVELDQLVRDAAAPVAVAYAFASLTVGVLAALAGIAAARRLTAAPEGEGPG